jgi:protein SCO1
MHHPHSHTNARAHLIAPSAFFIAVASVFWGSLLAHKAHHEPPLQDSISARQTYVPAVPATKPDTGTALAAQKSGFRETSLMGLEEKPGAMIPLDLKCANQRGDTVTLRQCISGPTLFTMLYFRCTDACGLLLSGISKVLRPFADDSATAPNFIALSIGEREGPGDAAKAQAIADQIMGKPYPAGRWHFLTASQENIRKVAEASGFHFVKKGDDYDHPLLVMVLSPQGKVTRYIVGTDFLPADVTLSLMEARKGTLQPTIARILRACFSYDPHGRRLVFKTLQVSATVILALLGAFAVFLFISSKRRRKKGPA